MMEILQVSIPTKGLDVILSRDIGVYCNYMTYIDCPEFFHLSWAKNMEAGVNT